MVQTVSLSIPTLLAMMQIVKRQSLQTNCQTFLCWYQLWKASLTLDHPPHFPFHKLLVPFKNSCSGHGRISTNITQHFQSLSRCLTQNLMLNLCPIVILQLNSLSPKNLIRSRTAIFYNKKSITFTHGSENAKIIAILCQNSC